MARILLTGAGFSKNWGGWLAAEVFEYLIGCYDVWRQPILHDILWANRNNGFEDALTTVRNRFIKNQSAENRSLWGDLESAIQEMFSEMNSSFEKYLPLWSSLEKDSLHVFLNKFDAIFTLNQDLLIENQYIPKFTGNWRWNGVQMPGVKISKRMIPLGYAPADSQNGYSIDQNKQSYFKLHGSSNWAIDEIGGSRIMVMGGEKERNISQFPLLEWYQEKLREYLHRPNTRLMTIGYGYKDEHINRVIVDACTVRSAKQGNFQLFIVDPRGVEALPVSLAGKIHRCVIGASRRTLNSIFQEDAVEKTKLDRFFRVS